MIIIWYILLLEALLEGGGDFVDVLELGGGSLDLVGVFLAEVEVLDDGESETLDFVGDLEVELFLALVSLEVLSQLVVLLNYIILLDTK